MEGRVLRAPGHGALRVRGQSHVAPLSTRTGPHLVRDDLVGFDGFMPSRAPAVGFYRPACWAHATARWSGCPCMPAMLQQDAGWQSLCTWAPVPGGQVGNIPGQSAPGIPGPREGLFLLRILKTFRSGFSGADGCAGASRRVSHVPLGPAASKL